MLQKKVCVLGAFGVGKTTLIRRFVESIFSDAYLTTVGVKVDKKTLTVGTEPLTLILWDIAGRGRSQRDPNELCARRRRILVGCRRHTGRNPHRGAVDPGPGGR